MSDYNEGSAGVGGEATSDHGGTCPYCKEAIKPKAVICKHCQSHLPIAPHGPRHGGTCPHCKESIKGDAVICKHCRSGVSGMPDSSMAGINFGHEAFFAESTGFSDQENDDFEDDDQVTDGDQFGAALAARLPNEDFGGSLGAYKIRCRWIKGTICDARGNCRPWWVRRCTIESAFM